MKDFEFLNPNNEALALKNLSSINVILGRNGSGKSRFLRDIDIYMNGKNEYRVRYVTPERAGVFRREGNIETNIASNPDWASHTRRKNQAPEFKFMSHLHLRNAEYAYLRELQNTDARGRSFQTDCLDPISRLLNNISIEQGDPDFVFRNTKGDLINPSELSSGESETIALASEILNFFRTIDASKLNMLLLDEPDVHQHPDLQARLGLYLINQFESLEKKQQSNVVVCLATHSTPLICSLANKNYTSIGNKEFDSNIVVLNRLSDQIRKLRRFLVIPYPLRLVMIRC